MGFVNPCHFIPLVGFPKILLLQRTIKIVMEDVEGTLKIDMEQVEKGMEYPQEDWNYQQ